MARISSYQSGALSPTARNSTRQGDHLAERRRHCQAADRLGLRRRAEEGARAVEPGADAGPWGPGTPMEFSVAGRRFLAWEVRLQLETAG